MLLASLVLILAGLLLVVANPNTTYTSTMLGQGTTASCERAFTALVGGGTTAPFAYHAYDLNPSAESDPIIRDMEREVAAEPARWEQRWHEEDHACTHTIRRNFAIGLVLLIVGVSLFVLRLRLPGRRRDLRVVEERRSQPVGTPGLR
jgi:hypothetical protein